MECWRKLKGCEDDGCCCENGVKVDGSANRLNEDGGTGGGAAVGGDGGYCAKVVEGCKVVSS